MYLWPARRASGRRPTLYWARWVAWAPFVGLFIARISECAQHSRTDWRAADPAAAGPLSIFGNTAISPCWKAGARSVRGAEAIAGWCSSCSNTPYTQPTAGFVVVISFVLSRRRRFRHADDSEPLLPGGSAHDDAPARCGYSGRRLRWYAPACCMPAVSSAMQTAVVLCGLPFSAVIVLYISLRKDLCRYAMKPVLP